MRHADGAGPGRAWRVAVGTFGAQSMEWRSGTQAPRSARQISVGAQSAPLALNDPCAVLKIQVPGEGLPGHRQRRSTDAVARAPLA